MDVSIESDFAFTGGRDGTIFKTGIVDNKFE